MAVNAKRVVQACFDEDETLLVAKFKSSNIAYLAYNVDINQVVAVFFSNEKKAYHYNEVPPQTFFKVMKADSIGSAFNKLIVKGGFDYYTTDL